MTEDLTYRDVLIHMQGYDRTHPEEVAETWYRVGVWLDSVNPGWREFMDKVYRAEHKED